MLKSEIKLGKEYALRESRAPGTPFQQVRVIAHVRRSKWKVEWIDPNPGLVDYVDSGHLIVRWSEHKQILRDEANAERLRDHNRRYGYDDDDSPVPKALQQIFECVGDEVWFERGSLKGSPDAIARVRERARFPADHESSVAYVDRHGKLRIPFDAAFELGRAFCATEPTTVLVDIERAERKWTQDVARGDDYLRRLLIQYRASWALIRQWASHDAAVAEREAEIQRLERLIWDAVYALQEAGLDTEASRIRAAISRS